MSIGMIIWFVITCSGNFQSSGKSHLKACLYLLNLLADIIKFNPNFVFKVIDSVLEEVRIGLEGNHFKDNQRRISVTRYVGLLYQKWRHIQLKLPWILFGKFWDLGIQRKIDFLFEIIRLTWNTILFVFIFYVLYWLIAFPAPKLML